MIKTILFDLDMTLIDFMKMKKIACEQAASAMIGCGLKMDLETASKKLLETYFEEGIESNTAFERFIKEQTGKENPENVEKLFKNVKTLNSKGPVPGEKYE